MSNPNFGTPRYGGGGSKTFRLKEGDNIYRIAPPMKTLARLGIWAVYRSVHYGFCVPNPRDPSKPMARPWLCLLEKDQNGMIVHDCPEHRKIEDQKELLADRVKTYRNQKKTV